MPVVPRVPIITRSEYGVSAAPKMAPLGPARRIVVHHTAHGYSVASRPGVTEGDGRSAVRNVRASHLARRFSDTGYHFVIDGAGRIYQGRAYVAGGSFGPGRTPPALAKGAHTNGHNTGTIGVCLLGCFGDRGDRTCGDTPSEYAVKALTGLLVALTRAYGVSPARIVGHRDLSPSACPGDRLYAMLPQIREAVKG